MARTHEYKLIIGTVTSPLNSQLAQEGQKGWKPILMSTPTDASGTVQVYVILEHALGT
jgi:hypothetical protein